MPPLPISTTTSPVCFTWLHLSDLHLETSHRVDRVTAFAQIRKAIADLYQQTKPWHAIFFNGDMVNWGLKAEYDEFTAWVDDLYQELQNIDMCRTYAVAFCGS